MEDSIYTVHDVANLYGVSEETVRRWTRSGELKPIANEIARKIGYAFSKQNLIEFEQSSKKYKTLTNPSTVCLEIVPEKQPDYAAAMNRVNLARAKLKSAQREYDQAVEELSKVLKKY